MSGLDPLMMGISIGNKDNTSLALPSVNQHRTGQERVREQVQSVRRTKLRHPSTMSGSTSLSPTSPSHESNGNLFFGNGFPKSYSIDRSLSSPQNSNNKITSMRTNTTFSRYMRNYSVTGPKPAGQLNSSRSEPSWSYGAPRPSIPTQRLPSNTGIYRNQQCSSKFIRKNTSRPHPVDVPNGSYPTKTNNYLKASRTDMRQTQSMTLVTDGPTKTTKSEANMAKVNMKEAVEFLYSKDENYQLFGASCIQQNTFNNDRSKEEVLKLKGIPALLALLPSSNSMVKHVVSATLRNLSFKSSPNKEEIFHCGGITMITDQLKQSGSVDLDKQLTGLLWNLSSEDDLKSVLLRESLSTLMERVIVPNTKTPDITSNANRDPYVFTNATACLRNLSSGNQNSRQTMRKCPGLVDSLVNYLKSCEEKDVDDEPLENSVCILHNLTFQLEAEVPSLFERIKTLIPANRSQIQNSGSAVGCFNPPGKSSEHDRPFDYPVVENPHPSGVGWLIHSKLLQSYLSLLKRSQRDELKKACCGSMHNLTASKGIVSEVIGQIIVKKLYGMQAIAPLLKSNKDDLQRAAMSLLINLLKNENLYSLIGREALPRLIDVLGHTEVTAESDDTYAMACQSTTVLLLNNPESNKNYLTNNLIKLLSNHSNTCHPKSSKAAAILLYRIWADKDLQSYVKKNGMNKSMFVNDTTTAACSSLTEH
ncbi:plakophilin-1 [Nothobranchius furzeri]|uniref:Plakophilin 1b n=3 Tax=Nothobranchius TaxID=28779 RepID=A0A1A8AN90_NOTFU|nr:plakophilin-1-like [Nothobranchius furzeri]